ncbi:MAG: response regulator transcription factor [Caldilineaceae bacterium]
MKDSPIRLLIVEDHEVVRQGLMALLSSSRYEFDVVGEAADGAQAIEMARALRPDLIVMDLEMPHKNGIEATASILAENCDIKILILTSFADPAKTSAAVRAGARGLLHKDASLDDLVRTIRSMARGQIALPAELMEAMLGGRNAKTGEDSLLDPLTERETHVLEGLVKGMSNRQIADHLHVSPNTVRAHVTAIMTKLGVANRTQAALYAVENKLLD